MPIGRLSWMGNAANWSRTVWAVAIQSPKATGSRTKRVPWDQISEGGQVPSDGVVLSAMDAPCEFPQGAATAELSAMYALADARNNGAWAGTTAYRSWRELQLRSEASSRSRSAAYTWRGESLRVVAPRSNQILFDAAPPSACPAGCPRRWKHRPQEPTVVSRHGRDAEPPGTREHRGHRVPRLWTGTPGTSPAARKITEARAPPGSVRSGWLSNATIHQTVAMYPTTSSTRRTSRFSSDSPTSSCTCRRAPRSPALMNRRTDPLLRRLRLASLTHPARTRCSVSQDNTWLRARPRSGTGPGAKTEGAPARWTGKPLFHR